MKGEIGTDWRGDGATTPEAAKAKVATSSGTHIFFQGSAPAQDPNEVKSMGYQIVGVPWRYQTPDRTEIRLEDGHGKRLFGN